MSNQRFIVSGTDTEIGKTIFSAMLTHVLKASYYKPVQSGLEEETDTEIVTRLAELSADRRLPEAYKLLTPASPHLSAEIDGVEIDLNKLTPPQTDRPLVIEGAGGLMVPLNRETLTIDMFKKWNAPVILCARTSLGTINHSLLSIEALKQRDIPILGIVFIGDENKDSERTIVEMGNVHRLGRLPRLAEIGSASLEKAFEENFNLSDFS